MINEKFVIKKLLGQGRSKVFLCENVFNPANEFAIKVLSPEAGSEEASYFRDEFFSLRKLNHPNIITAEEIGTVVKAGPDDFNIQPGSTYFTMEYFNGSRLLDYDCHEDTLKIIIKQLSSVLYYLHQSNYIYYDLKAENILVSDIDNKPVIKLIDLGLAAKNTGELTAARGTAEYIAPELIGNDFHDHRADLYSLGILLYRIVYKKFPFSFEREIDIFKAHLEQEFDFPGTSFSTGLINAIKKLTAKKPADRYFTTLQLLYDLNIPVDDISDELLPVSSFVCRKDILAVITSYIQKQKESEIITLRGSEGSGKTSILQELHKINLNSVFIYESAFSDTNPLWKVLLRRTIYSGFIYPYIPDEIRKDADKLLTEGSALLIDSLKSLFLRVTAEINFIILLDDINRYDNFSIEIIKQLVPVLQSNNIKIIVTEDTSISSPTDTFNNLVALNLSSFTEADLNQYMDSNYAVFFPKEAVKKLVMVYADLLPGSIDSFIRDLILFKYIRFLPEGPQVVADNKILKKLAASHSLIYEFRLKGLNDGEMQLIRFLSLFQEPVSYHILALLLGTSQDYISAAAGSLKKKDILNIRGLNLTPEFSSQGIKNFIYENIPDKKVLHSHAAGILRANTGLISRKELARQYELAGLYYESYAVLMEEAESAEKVYALSYKRILLEQLACFPLEKEDINNIQHDLALTCFRLGDKKAANVIIDLLLDSQLPHERVLELQVLKGNCLVFTGSPAEGISLLKSILPGIKEEEKIQEILLDIANAEMELNNFKTASDICSEIINNEKTNPFTLGKAYNLQALINIYESSDMDKAIDNFTKALRVYKDSNLQTNISIEMNIGNIYYLRQEFDAAVKHWENARELNRNIGNLDTEAKLFSNFASLYFTKQKYEKAITDYKKAENIQSSLGDQQGLGVTLFNLGEVHLNCCDYDLALNELKSARKISSMLKNDEQQAEIIFMIGRCYFIIGYNHGLKEAASELKAVIYRTGNERKFKYDSHLLELLINYNEGKTTGFIKKLTELSRYYSDAGNENLYSFILFILCDFCLKNSSYDEVYNLLQDAALITASKNNIYIDAQRKYYLGKLAEAAPQFNLSSSLHYYEESFKEIENESVTELTWQLLYSLAGAYNKRGNRAKAREYSQYLFSLINYIADNIKDKKLRKSYLLHHTRKKALEII